MSVRWRCMGTLTISWTHNADTKTPVMRPIRAGLDNPRPMRSHRRAQSCPIANNSCAMKILMDQPRRFWEQNSSRAYVLNLRCNIRGGSEGKHVRVCSKQVRGYLGAKVPAGHPLTKQHQQGVRRVRWYRYYWLDLRRGTPLIHAQVVQRKGEALEQRSSLKAHASLGARECANVSMCARACISLFTVTRANSHTRESFGRTITA